MIDPVLQKFSQEMVEDWPIVQGILAGKVVLHPVLSLQTTRTRRSSGTSSPPKGGSGATT
jgi:hypothetical protein